jgi:siroheme synthase
VLPEHTLVLMMGRSNLGALAADLIGQGRDPATPAACIQSATTPSQRVTRATLATIAEAVERDGLESPVVTVIGAVAGIGGKRGSGEAGKNGHLPPGETTGPKPGSGSVRSLLSG